MAPSILISAILLVAHPTVEAQEDERGKYNPVLAIGEEAPSWDKLPGVDGKSYSLEDFSDAEIVVVVFTCNSCPYAVDYEDRIIALHEKYREEGVAVVAINVNTIPADRFDMMQTRAEEKGFEYPYLYDESQQIAKAYGATYTPEFFVLNKQRQVVYMGAMDDSSKVDKVTKRYVEGAIDAIKSGKELEVKETPAIGCRIRINRQRRDR